ncbi:MAG TPA: response regulator [Candidatus Krumholzibacteria bacterium]|nr:response regulator [Candidatus Krumholzibacteria bacterium]
MPMDSRSLFARQVRSQCETLCELLACPAEVPVPEGVLERCKVSIRMLAGSMLVVDLNDWSRLLNAAETLLTVHGERRLAWDERIAQVIFELIEKEELLASCHERDGEEGARKSIPAHEVEALIAGVEALREECERMEPALPPAAPAPVVPERLGNVAGQLRAACEKVLAAIGSESWQTRNTGPAAVEELRRALGTIEFYARATDRIVASVEEAVIPPRCDLAPLETALGDFANELMHGSGRELVIRISGEGIQIEPSLLPAAYRILHAMTADIFERCNESRIEIRIAAEDRRGALHWTVGDNGENFLSDSRLDHEDQLAFYPGLRHVVRTLKEHHGTLAVEPGGGKQARFEFSLPASTQAESLVLWEHSGRTFSARAAQVVRVVPANADIRRENAYGEHLLVDGRKIPLIKLDVLFPDAPPGGSHIAILGALEKNVAFYVHGEGAARAGVVLGDSIPVWKGAPHEVARVDGRRVPLLDADDLLRGYLSITGTVSYDAISAGSAHDSVEMYGADGVESGEAAPPDAGESHPAGDEIEILIIEQSEATRNAFTDILARQRIRASFAGDVEEALGLIRLKEPRIIISEFRIPTMAAKRIVDSLRKEGLRIPVLVTTSQSGKTADLLVEKLGASGYLSKPLTSSQVTSQIAGFLGVAN